MGLLNITCQIETMSLNTLVHAQEHFHAETGLYHFLPVKEIIMLANIKTFGNSKFVVKYVVKL